MKKYLKFLLFVLIGGIGGYAYYYFIGCRTGTCPITSNPWNSTLYGVLMGTILGWNSSLLKRTGNEKQEREMQ